MAVEKQASLRSAVSVLRGKRFGFSSLPDSFSQNRHRFCIRYFHYDVLEGGLLHSYRRTHAKPHPPGIPRWVWLCAKLQFSEQMHWRGSTHGFPLGGSCQESALRNRFLTDEGNNPINRYVSHIMCAVPSSAPPGHLPPKGKALGVAQLLDKLEFDT